MTDAVDVPILFDGDSGFGNFNNVRRVVRKLCQRRVAGICIEDKLFPKLNSFHRSHQELAPKDEFVGKVKAAKDSQVDDSFCVVARTEAFIAGYGVAEALERADAYSNAGADAVLVHSKRSDPSEILEFAKLWNGRSPLVIVPTTYASMTPTDVFRNIGITTVIWANHTMRAAVSAMRAVARQVYERQAVSEIEKEIASVRDLFDLINMDELIEAEKLYMPCTQGREANGRDLSSRGAGYRNEQAFRKWEFTVDQGNRPNGRRDRIASVG
jgi:phosphoenolpyruvate phosphomutase